jgi:HPt (histidine-containing phosphotransfer) domain-containing protein
MNMEKMATDLGLDSGEFYELVEVFVETTTSDLAKLESAISARKATQVVEAAHSIKGAAGSLGFEDAQNLAKKIEMNARENILDGSLEDAVTIKKTLKAISQALEENGSHGPS